MKSIGCRLFNLHDYKIVASEKVEVWTESILLGTESSHGIGVVALERCTKCGKEKAWVSNGRIKQSQDVDFIKIKYGLE